MSAAERATDPAYVVELEAALDRVRALAEDMRTWCSPHGVAVHYADAIDEAAGPRADRAQTSNLTPENAYSRKLSTRDTRRDLA